MRVGLIVVMARRGRHEMETAAGGVTLSAGALALAALREAYAQSWTRVVPLAVAAFRMRLMAVTPR